MVVIVDRELTGEELAALSRAAGSPGDRRLQLRNEATATSETHVDRVHGPPVAVPTGVRFSKAAEVLIADHGIDRRHCARLGAGPGLHIVGAGGQAKTILHLFADLRGQGLRFAFNPVGGVVNRQLRPAIWDPIRISGFGFPTLGHPEAAVDTNAQLGGNTGARRSLHWRIDHRQRQLHHQQRGRERPRLRHRQPPTVPRGYPGSWGEHRPQLPGRHGASLAVSFYLGVTVGADTIIATGVDVFEDVRDGAVL